MRCSEHAPQSQAVLTNHLHFSACRHSLRLLRLSLSLGSRRLAHPMRLILFLTVFATATLMSACGPNSYTIAPTESMAKTLKFDKPANLLARPLEQFDPDLQKALGKPLSAFGFRDFAASEYSYDILFYPTGAAFGTKRNEVERDLQERQQKLEKLGSNNSPPFGVREVAGRKVLNFMLGFGEGGESTAILFPHRTEPFEILVIQSIDYRKPPYPDNKVPDAKPTINYYDAVSAIESMVTIQ